MKNSCKNAAVTGCLDWLDAFSNPAPWFVWDPTEPVATRPLVFRYAPNSLKLFYAFDGNKNVSDVFYRMTSNGIGVHYDYAPFGVELPDLSGGYQWGVVGGEITLGAKGAFWAVLYEGESISI